MLTGPEAGITRDAISSDFEWRGSASGCGTRPASAASQGHRQDREAGGLRRAARHPLRRMRDRADRCLDADRESGSDARAISSRKRAAPSSWRSQQVGSRRGQAEEPEGSRKRPRGRAAGNPRRAGRDAVGQAGARTRQAAQRGARRHGDNGTAVFPPPSSTAGSRRRSNAIRRPHRRGAASRSATPPRPVRGRPPSPSSATSWRACRTATRAIS